MMRSKSAVETETLHAGFFTRFFAFTASGLDVKYTNPSIQSAPSGITCGEPSGFVVASQEV